MELSFSLPFESLIESAKKLPKEQLQLLISELNSYVFREEQPKTSLQELLLKAPTWSAETLKEVKEARAYINKTGKRYDFA
jgi:hypothetical protein